MSKKPIYKSILLKLSGEALLGSRSHGIDAETCASFATQIKGVHKLGTKIALVVGAGNFFRGQVESERFGLDQSVADYMGMLATVLNGTSPPAVGIRSSRSMSVACRSASGNWTVIS